MASTPQVRFQWLALPMRQVPASCDNTLDAGPFATHCDQPRFDFTLIFEQLVFGIIPSALFILAAFSRIYELQNKSNKVVPSSLAGLKAVAHAIFTAFQVALLILWAEYDGPLSRKAALADSALRLACALILGGLSYIEHNRAVRPSTCISLYLISTFIFDTIECRTLWLIGQSNFLPPVITAALSAKLLLFFLELKEKQNILLDPWKKPDPESSASIVNRGFLWWVNRLLFQGYQAALSPQTLGEIGEDLHSDILLRKFQASWDKISCTRFASHCLSFAILDALKSALLKCLLPRLFMVAFALVRPLLLSRTISFVQNERGQDENNLYSGYGLILATGVAGFGSAIATSFYQQYRYRALTMARGSLVSFIYYHSLDFDPSSTEKQSSDVITLTSRDVSIIVGSLGDVHEIWGNSLQLILAIYLLWLQTTVAFMGPIIPIIVCTLLTTQVSKFMPAAMKVWNEAIQLRVGTTSKVLGGIREVKLLGLTSLFLKKLQLLRADELKKSKSFRMLIVLMNMIGNTAPPMAPIATFGITLLFSRLSLVTAFTSLAIINLVSEPLSSLVHTIPSFFSAFGAVERVQSFVLECHQHRKEEPYRDNNDDLVYSNFNAGVEEESIIDIVDGAFMVTPKQEPLLSDINLRIKRSTMTLITGKVGSGKSALLQAFLGRFHSKGRVKLPPAGVAYCAQTPWLTNTTIRRNIQGLAHYEHAMDEAWYQVVVHGCALDEDFESLTHGDHSLVGSRGLTLSGGQKQRIALARALYQKRPLIILDDVFSGLDSKTQDRVWNRVFGHNGILRKQRVTVILATHTIRFLEQADRIIVVENGQVLQQGSFVELQDQLNLDKMIASEESNKPSEDEHVHKASTAEKAQEQWIDRERQLEALRQSGDTSLYLYYFKSVGWGLGLVALTTSVVLAFISLASPLWLRLWTEAADRGGSLNNGFFFGVYILLQALYLLVLSATFYLMFLLIIPKSAENLHWKLLQTTMKAPLSFFTSTDTGNLVNRFSEDMSLVENQLPVGLFVAATKLQECVTETALIMIGSWFMSFVVPPTIIFLYYLQKFYLRTSQQLRMLDIQTKAPLVSHIMETNEGLVTIGAFGWQSTARDMAMTLLDESQKPHYLLYIIQRWLNLVLELYVAGSAVILLSIAILTETATAGGIAISLLNLMGLNENLAQLISGWTNLETSLGSIARLRNFELTTPKEVEPLAETLVVPSLHWPMKGHLVIEDLEASYSNKPEVPPVLREISLEVNPGQKLAICGRTGSGKSSLLLALSKMITYTGSIKLDGIDIGYVSPNTLRSRLITVCQEPVLFPGTLRQNLYPEAEDSIAEEEFITVLKKVELWDQVEAKDGLDSAIETFVFSQGQKQLLSLARAILKQNTSNMVILDEAMSAVDKNTEQLMVRLLEEEFSGHTIISVAHRLETVRNFDRMIVLDQGRIIRTGAPSELLTSHGTLDI